MQRPELVLVHGAWHGAWAWERLMPILASRGWKATAVELPSSGSTANMSADAAIVRGVLQESSTPKVLVGHSYGGIVITQAGASVPNLLGLIYVSAAKPDLGDVGWHDPPAKDEVPAWIEVDTRRRIIHAHQAALMLYNDCPSALAAAAAARLQPQSLASFLEPVTAVAWRELPSAYLVCELDKCNPPALQEGLAAGAEYVERVAASHSPFLSMPAEVEGFIGRAVASFLPEPD